MLAEKDLIIRIHDGDLGAFRQLVSEHEKLVLYMISKILKNEDDIKDVSQDVFIKVYKNLKKFNFESKLSTWIAQIAYTTALNFYKKQKKNQTEILTEDIKPFTNITPEAISIKKSDSEFLQAQIDQLPVIYKTVLTLFHINECSYQEIEEITRLPAGTIKSHLFRARKILKERLEKYLS
ncbi:sigma-70 family RNA polymerase sigma factor [Mucilaginibacter sp. CAU 1740]|uniref:RNA polymerase sigma factor n=1 Tax=Mucilaginibacter sp. CAU 1740 TaxID=3140365 RepID=UPI00325B6C95